MCLLDDIFSRNVQNTKQHFCRLSQLGSVIFTDSGAIYLDISSMPCNRKTAGTKFSDLFVCVQNHLATKAQNTIQNVGECLPIIFKNED
jgi:hypothetical protein